MLTKLVFGSLFYCSFYLQDRKVQLDGRFAFCEVAIRFEQIVQEFTASLQYALLFVGIIFLCKRRKITGEYPKLGEGFDDSS